MATINTFTTLHTHGHETDSDVITLYLQGGYGLTVNSNATLFEAGHYAVNKYATLFVSGMIEVNDNMTLYTDSIGVMNKIAYLIINGHVNAVNKYASLYVFGGTAGYYSDWGSIPLYMPTPSYERGMPLFIKNTQPNVPMNASRFLFIGGRFWTLSDALTLFLENGAIDAEMTLYLKVDRGGGGTTAIPTSRGMPLFINRPDESTWMPLFLKAADNIVNSYATLHIRSAIEVNNNITLAIPNVTSQPLNSYISLQVEGAIGSTDSATLFTDAHGVLSGSTTLVVKQETRNPNSYATLFTKGAYLDTASMTLALPSVLGESPDEIPLYVFGW
jgi:hypothetical protein